MDYYKLDEKDIVILQTLSTDSRTKLSFLADLLHTSIPTIKSRIDKLEALGIIQQFSIILSYELLSEHPLYFIFLKIKPIRVATIIENLQKEISILEIHEILGMFQVFLKTYPLNMNDFNVLHNKLRLMDGIDEISIQPLATTFKHNIAQLPHQDIRVKIRCEYCGKQIEKDYQTMTINEVTHFFCCKSCLTNYQNELEHKISSQE